MKRPFQSVATLAVATLLAGCASGDGHAERDIESMRRPTDPQTGAALGAPSDRAFRLRTRGDGYGREDAVFRDLDGRPRSYRSTMTWPR